MILPRRGWAWAFVVTVAVTAACAARAPVSVFEKRLPLLIWLGEFTRPAGTEYPQLTNGVRFGSLSGLAPDEGSKSWIAVSDDRDGTRVAWLDVTAGAQGLAVAPIRMLPLRAGPGVPPRTATQADLEAIVALPDGTFLAAEEGHVQDGEVWQPAILRVTREGVVTAVIEYPREFHITAGAKTGLRDNQGIESLALTPGGRVIAGLEQPLIEDGQVTFERGAAGRLIAFERSGSSFRAGRQWRYMISPTPRIEGFDELCNDGENGLVDLLALSETRLISMERACLADVANQRFANAVQLFIVDLIDGDARKQELLNFDAMTWRLSPALAHLENFEAMAFGPVVNGMPTLLIVSDDNFRATQKTAFLLLGMR
jgi:hypothetical protein